MHKPRVTAYEVSYCTRLEPRTSMMSETLQLALADLTEVRQPYLLQIAAAKRDNAFRGSDKVDEVPWLGCSADGLLRIPESTGPQV